MPNPAPEHPQPRPAEQSKTSPALPRPGGGGAEPSEAEGAPALPPGEGRGEGSPSPLPPTPASPLSAPSPPAADGSVAHHTPYDPPQGPIEVVFANEHFVVLNKPSGLLSVPGRGEEKADCLASRAQAMFPSATGPLTVHRLDMETSGLTVLALDAVTHAKLSRQFIQRKVKKNYVALLAGELDPALPDEGCIELPLIVDWPNRPRHMVHFDRGKPAKTYYTVLERIDRHPDYPDAGPLTRVRFRPITGRTHQLRLHAAHPPELTPAGNRGGLGRPILADPLYSDTRRLAPRLMLHATLLCFWNPRGNEWLRFESPEPF